jgi:AcrR family transcriptional regulator
MLYTASSMKKAKKTPNRRAERVTEPQKRGDAVREGLISSCDRLLKTHPPSKITTAMLLAEADVARGTLYHHFKSVSALVESTLLEAFSTHVDANITALRALADHSRDQTEFAEGLRQVTKISQSSARQDTRFARTRLIAYSETSASLRKMLAREQERLTTAIEAIVVTSQKKGWVKRSIKPRAAAVLIQAYTLGKIVDDVAETRMPEADWNALIDEVVIGGMLVRD